MRGELIVPRELLQVVAASTIACVQSNQQRIFPGLVVAERCVQAIGKLVALLVHIHFFAKIDVVLGEFGGVCRPQRQTKQ